MTAALHDAAVASTASVLPLRADYFDGRSTRPQAVTLRARADCLHIEADTSASPGLPLVLPLSQIEWPERTRHGARIAQLPGGASLQALDVAAWDAFVATCGAGDSLVVRGQRSWRLVAIALVLRVVLLAVAWRWGLPLAADAVVAVLPPSVDDRIGNATLKQARAQWIGPSQLPPGEQAALRAAFEQLLAAVHAQPMPHRIEFGHASIGPNAFALPGGTIVVTDQLVALLQSDTAAVVAVLAHEYGHVQRRHAIRQLVQAALAAGLGGMVFGDIGGALAAMPVLLGTLDYSRGLERQADGDAIALLQAAGQSPAAMLRFFDAIAVWRSRQHEEDPTSLLGIALSSHPADAERVERFRTAAAR